MPLLGFVCLAAILSLGWIIVSTPTAFSPIAPATQDPLRSSPALQPVVVFQLPATWTPAPGVISSPLPALATLNPSFTPPATATPIASLTPFYPAAHLIIGYSVANRPLEVYQFGSGSQTRMLVAGIHGGDEWNTIALANELVAYLRQHPRTVPPGVTLYILASLNPDGEARGHDLIGRTNAHNVDLNRNWPVGWKSQWRTDGCASKPPITAGSTPASEPETQALMSFLLTHPVRALIDYHSAGLGIFPAGSPPDPDSQRLAQAISAISVYPYPPVRSNCEYTGTLVDWTIQHGTASVDLELSDHTHTEFDENLKILNLLFQWQ